MRTLYFVPYTFTVESNFVCSRHQLVLLYHIRCNIHELTLDAAVIVEHIFKVTLECVV